LINVGDASHYPGTGPSHNQNASHVCIVIKIDADNDDIYSVPVSSELANLDETCIINPGEGCSFVTKKSFIAYFHARKSSLRGIIAQLSQRHGAKNLGQIPEAIFQRVVQGILRSDDTEPAFKRAFSPPERPQPPRRILNAK
jgi:hypothetical protein